MIINNPGGFPKGVTIENLLTVSSTPRSRLMAEVLEKTCLLYTSDAADERSSVDLGGRRIIKKKKKNKKSKRSK